MRPIQRLIHAGFATAAIASASVPALAWTVWPDVDFEWYADVGRVPAAAMPAPQPVAREGWIWSPGHWTNLATRDRWIAGHWVKDEYDEQYLASAQAARLASAARDVPRSSPMDRTR
jgi:hypothetical protein